MAIQVQKLYSYLHFDYISPLKADKVQHLLDDGKRVILLESNQDGQFGKLLAEETGIKLKEQYFKYDGRAFSVDDILDYLNR